jgi:acetyl-CoA carboxylase biotin carboxyl carrier protein
LTLLCPNARIKVAAADQNPRNLCLGVSLKGTFFIVTDFGISSDDLQRLAHLVEENGLSELRYEEGDLRITLRTASYSRPSPVTYAVSDAASSSTPTDGFDTEWFDSSLAAGPGFAENSLSNDSSRIRIEAPVMGVFYRAPGQGEPAFIEVGDIIEVGQPIGIIEAMKVFSEVLAETAGTVLEIPAKNGALVQPGDALVLLEEVE